LSSRLSRQRKVGQLEVEGERVGVRDEGEAHRVEERADAHGLGIRRPGDTRAEGNAVRSAWLRTRLSPAASRELEEQAL
jgi:hypothetical protein